MLANDPHLAPAVPPHWYLARMQSPGWAVAGAALPGTPAIAVGHNGNCAWGVTAGLTDNTDLFLERIGTDGRSVLEDGEYVQCETRREEIRVRGAKPVEEEVLVTSRGPIISPALDGELGAVSMRAVWLDALPVRGFLGTQEAKTFEEFRAPFADWPILPLNLVYADTHGNVGYQLVGQAPRRRRGFGTVPSAGWIPRAGWEEEGVPFDEMPRSLSPACGYVATANTQPEPHGSGPFLGIDWIDGYRLGRIAEALEERSDWDVDSTAALQMDVKSMPWAEMRETVLAGPPGNAETRAARELLESWDGRMASDSVGATLFHFFLAEMSRRVARARAPRTATLKHPLGRMPVLGVIFNLGPFECPGDVNTVAQAGTIGEDPLASPGVVPSMRMVLDVGDWDRSLFSLPGGQSGNPLSPHYDDLLPAWLEGTGVPIPWTGEAVEAATVETLLLKPASKGPHS